MNSAVASYVLLTLASSTFSVISMAKFRGCIECLYHRDHKPALFSIFVFLAWAIVGGNGIWVKWHNPLAKLGIDTPILVLLITSTLFILMYALHNVYRRRCDEVKREACPVYPADRRVPSVVRRK